MAIFHRSYNLFICQTAERTDFDLWIRATKLFLNIHFNTQDLILALTVYEAPKNYFFDEHLQLSVLKIGLVSPTFKVIQDESNFLCI